MEQHKPTPPEVKAFLSRRFDGAVSNVALVGQGEWSDAYSFLYRDREYIIRFSAFAEDFAKDQLAASFASARLPIPKIVEIGAAFDGFFAVSEKAVGSSFDNLDQQGMRDILPALFDVLDAMREVDVSKTAGYGSWNAEGIGPNRSWAEALLDIANDQPENRTYGWRSRLAASSAGMQAFDEAYRQLTALVENCPEERHLVHADLLNHNVLVRNNQVTAVIDWGCAKYGDFLYDLAWLSFWSAWYPAMKGIDFRQEARQHYHLTGLDVPNFEERLRCYEIHIGLDSLAYSSFKGRWAFVEEVSKHTLEIARQR